MMNEKIKELAVECETTYIDRDGREYAELDIGKFAELIIEQCAEIAEDASIQKIPASQYGELIRLFEREPFTTYFDNIKTAAAERFIKEQKHRWQDLPEDCYEHIKQAVDGLEPVDAGDGTHCYNYVYEIGDKLYDFIYEYSDKTKTPIIMWKMKKI
jgi:hypothetical protein